MGGVYNIRMHCSMRRCFSPRLKFVVEKKKIKGRKANDQTDSSGLKKILRTFSERSLRFFRSNIYFQQWQLPTSPAAIQN